MRGQPHYFSPTPILPRLVRFCYGTLLAAVLVAGAYYALVYAPSVWNSGSLAPSAVHVVARHVDGETLYITQRQQLLLNLYGIAFAVSLLAWLMLGILLEVKLKVRIFRGVPAPLPREPKHRPPAPFSHN